MCVCVCARAHAQLRPVIFDPLDYSLPGSSVPGIFQARILDRLPFPSPGNLPAQGLNPPLLGLLHCRGILYCWALGEAFKSLTLFHAPQVLPTPVEMWAPLFHYHQGTTCSVKILQKFKTSAERGSVCHVPLCNLLFLKFWGMPRTVLFGYQIRAQLIGNQETLFERQDLSLCPQISLPWITLLVLVFLAFSLLCGEPSSVFWGSRGRTSEKDYSYTYEPLISPSGNSENRRCVYYQASHRINRTRFQSTYKYHT